MKTKIIEATNGPLNWGKFLVGKFDVEWARTSRVNVALPHRPLLNMIGWSEDHYVVLDLQTGEGAVFRVGPGASAGCDLDKHRVWVCPLFEPFLEWLYRTLEAKLPHDFDGLPEHVDLPTAPFALHGYRREGTR